MPAPILALKARAAIHENLLLDQEDRIIKEGGRKIK